MIRYVLLFILCICFCTLFYIAFIQKSPVEKRLLMIQNSVFSQKPEEQRIVRKNRFDFKFLHVPENVRAMIVAADLKLSVEEFVMVWISISFLPALFFYIVSGNTLFSMIVVLLCVSSPPLYIGMKKKKRLELFGNQLGDALLLISNGLRAGFSFEQVLETVSKELPNPIAQEFARVSRELKMGMSLSGSLGSMTERMENTDLRLLTSAVLIQRQVGGNLADILDTISITIQDRIKIKNNIKTMTAQGRISGIIVGAIPIVLFMFLSFINHDYMSVFYETVIGKIMLVVIVIMEFFGFIFIRKMITIDA